MDDDKEKVDGKGTGKDSDEESISSYETGHEMFFDEEGEGERQQAPAVPEKEVQGGSSDVSQSTVDANYPSNAAASSAPNGNVNAPRSNTTPAPVPAQAPVRRKSVRMSLQPTFSPTPPALEPDEEVVDKEPWASPVASQNARMHAAATAPASHGVNGSARGGWEMRRGRELDSYWCWC